MNHRDRELKAFIISYSFSKLSLINICPLKSKKINYSRSNPNRHRSIEQIFIFENLHKENSTFGPLLKRIQFDNTGATNLWLKVE